MFTIDTFNLRSPLGEKSGLELLAFGEASVSVTESLSASYVEPGGLGASNTAHQALTSILLGSASSAFGRSILSASPVVHPGSPTIT